MFSRSRALSLRLSLWPLRRYDATLDDFTLDAADRTRRRSARDGGRRDGDDSDGDEAAASEAGGKAADPAAAGADAAPAEGERRAGGAADTAADAEDDAEDTGARFTQLYTDGEECDLTGAPRTTRVHYTCGDDGAAAKGGASVAAASAGVVIGNTRHENIPYIVRIREGATCDYDILIALPAVCEAERRRRRAAVPHRTVDCTVVPADAE